LSQRSFRRAHQRRVAAERRRNRLRTRRAALAAGAAAGAFALAAPAAHADTFQVNTLTDSHTADGCDPSPADCTLRDAVDAANTNDGPDTIAFQSGLSGNLDLAQGEIQSNDSYRLTINGPGAGVITISAGGNSRVFDIGDSNPRFTISGLTLTGGNVAGSGGAIYLGDETDLTLTASTINDSTATGQGGGIGTYGSDSDNAITISGSTISGNDGGTGGGVSTWGPLTISGSTISGNHANSGAGGGINAGRKYGPLAITDSTISSNTATGAGGGINFFPAAAPKYSPGDNLIANTTISGNHTDADGAGLYVAGIRSQYSSFTITHSTISGNDGASGSYGGGIQFAGQVSGAFYVNDSTLSGNTADTGAGASFHPPSPTATGQVGPNGSVFFDSSTIASNTAALRGGGLYLGYYGPSGGPYNSATIPLRSTIVADNTANGSDEDLDLADVTSTGGFKLAFSLVEAPGDGIASQSSSIVDTDPQLGGLANNGGPTLTELPAASSPAIDAGKNVEDLATDQRGDPRTIDLSPPNVADGTDIGAVERAAPQPPAQPAIQPPVTTPKKKCKKHKKRSADSAKKKKCKKKKKRR
jgi:CSLREA domain-containing protein